MNAVQALEAARAAGITIALDGDDLMLHASAQPPGDVLELLSHHKPGIVVLLRPDRDGWTAGDWRALFDERAGIAQFDGKLSPCEAEAQAFACCMIEWLNQNPDRSLPGRCLGCGGAERPEDPVLPFGTEPGSHAWLHGACWPTWYSQRKAKAIAALASMGVVPPIIFDEYFRR